MHEHSVAKSLVDLVEQEAQKAAAKRVKTIRLAIGDQSHIDEASLKMHFDLIAAGRKSISQGAEFQISRTPMKFRCDACSVDFEIVNHEFRCPVCERSGRMIGRGDELRVESIEVMD
ncbi:hydrogenase maturation nickel metallochaperone HypA [Candidatus Acetothermia bacterium]|nr:hydrogenase maturation nickel metallochaperone HypA [Candidatus Acetothermia bacterium]MBI3644301.1 hydrogenase maturation nickel metallochaperone HypA [Candidatus Acetothermia bacterium]